MKVKMFSFMLLVHILAVTSGCKEGKDPIFTQEPANGFVEEITFEECEKCIILSEQANTQVAIVDVGNQNIIWSWKPENSNVKKEHLAWFSNISDAKVVYNGKYIITCASGGGVALIRIKDKKTMFYAYAGGNVHSVELLPDGNLVSASSTGDHLTLFKVDTVNFPENVYSKQIPIEFGHNLVWDKQNEILWSAANNELIAYEYNFNCEAPDLSIADKLTFPGKDAHDLFPVFGQNALWLTNAAHIYIYDIETRNFSLANSAFHSSIKSISSGPNDFPTIIIKPKVSWWTDEVIDLQGNSVYYHPGFKIYKARWFLPNTFSYPEDDRMKVCGEY